MHHVILDRKQRKINANLYTFRIHWQSVVKLGQWVTSLEADSISFRPASRGRKLDSLAQHDLNSFRSRPSMTRWSLILKNIMVQCFGISARRNINNHGKTEEFHWESWAGQINAVLDHTYPVSGISGRPPHPHLLKYLQISAVIWQDIGGNTHLKKCSFK